VIAMNLFAPKPPIDVAGYRRSPAVTIRWAAAEDAAKLAILAEFDEASMPAAPVLLGFVGDELWVAVSVSTGATISDPFRPSAEVAELVIDRARQLTVPQLGRPQSVLKRLRDRLTPPRHLDAGGLPSLHRETR
jgi:hypothetical protein